MVSEFYFVKDKNYMYSNVLGMGPETFDSVM